MQLNLTLGEIVTLFSIIITAAISWATLSAHAKSTDSKLTGVENSLDKFVIKLDDLENRTIRLEVVTGERTMIKSRPRKVGKT